MFEQTVAIELEKRARLREFSLKLRVREAFVLVFPAVERHYSTRERERSEGFSSSDFKILDASNQIIMSGFFAASTLTRRRRRRREEEDQQDENNDDDDEKLLLLESPPEMNEDINNNNNDDDDFEEEDSPAPRPSPPRSLSPRSLSPPRIDIADEADQVCFQIERVVHRLMSSLASEICRDEAFPVEYYDLHVPLHEWSENEKIFVESEKTRSIRLNTITFARVIAMLNLIHTNVRQGKTVTQREMYYCASAKEPLLFSKVVHVLNAIKDIAGLLRIDRGALNITSASKGLVVGLVSLRNDVTQTFVDCSKLDGSGFTIPGDLKTIESLSIDASLCAFILVVEKDAVFNKLVQERIWERYPCAVVTAKGFPDLPTRAFLNRLALTGVQRTCKIYVLVDWNPSGLWIYSTYVTGGASNVNESTKYALRNAVFLGVSHEDILAAGKVLTSKHTKKESRDIANALRRKRGPLYSTFKSELEQMHALGRKCEIEGLYASNINDDNCSVLSEYVLTKIAQIEQQQQQRR